MLGSGRLKMNSFKSGLACPNQNVKINKKITNDNMSNISSRLSAVSGFSSNMSEMNVERFETQLNKRLKQVEKTY